jgi:hypothetical protein
MFAKVESRMSTTELPGPMTSAAADPSASRPISLNVTFSKLKPLPPLASKMGDRPWEAEEKAQRWIVRHRQDMWVVSGSLASMLPWYLRGTDRRSRRGERKPQHTCRGLAVSHQSASTTSANFVVIQVRNVPETRHPWR